MHTCSPIVRHDRDAARDFSPMKIGAHTVRRAPLRDTNYTIYSVMLDGAVAGRQLSYPSEQDCATHVRAAGRSKAVKGQSAALLDTDLHDRLIDLLRIKELDPTSISRTFGITSTALAPVLSMLVAEARIVRRGTDRRRIYAAS